MGEYFTFSEQTDLDLHDTPADRNLNYMIWFCGYRTESKALDLNTNNELECLVFYLKLKLLEMVRLREVGSLPLKPEDNKELRNGTRP